MKNRKKLARRSMVVEGLEERRVLAASVGWDGPGQGSADLTYYIGQAPSGMSQSTFEAAIETALKAWSDVVDIDFTQTTQAGLNNSLDFSAVRIDGSGGTLAQAYFPADLNRSRIAGDVQFDSAERWEVGNALGNSAFDIVLVAAHEIGHALGLDHSSDSSAVLYPSVSPSESFAGLDTDDVEAIQTLYTSRSSNSTDTSTNTGTNTGDNTNTPTTRIPSWLNRTTRFTQNSWFANWYNRFGGFRGGMESLDSETPTNHNLFNPLDVNSDDSVSPIDALLVINILNDNGNLTTEIKVDTNGDGQITPLDALLVINGIGDEQSTTTITINLSGDSPLVTVVRTQSNEGEATDDSGNNSGNDSNSDSGSGTDDNSVNPGDDSSIDDGSIDDANNTGDDTTDSGTDTDDADDTDESHSHPHHRFGKFGFGLRFGWLSPDRVDSLFERLDDNTDELLTEDEVPSRLWVHWVDEGIDTDADAAISVDELNAAVRAKQQAKFDMLDDDSDGLLTESELTARQWRKLTNAEADTDADGGISLDELLAFQATASGFGGRFSFGFGTVFGDQDCTDDSDDNSDNSGNSDDPVTTPSSVATTLITDRDSQSSFVVQLATALRSMRLRFR